MTKKKDDVKDDVVNTNMELWSKVCETNPAITKKVTTRGGFTAIDAQTQVKKATELWGSYGSTWGLKEFDIKLFHNNIGDIIGLYIKGLFYYPNGEFAIGADMPYKPNDDCAKKLQTECISKALSRLGFNSDVFEGKFDDNKYVAEMNNKYNSKETEPKIKSGTIIVNNAAGSITIPGDDYKAAGITIPGLSQDRVLRLIYDSLMSKLDNKEVVDIKLLEKEIISKFGKLPVNEKSVDKVLAGIDSAVCCKENDFIKGLDGD